LCTLLGSCIAPLNYFFLCSTIKVLFKSAASASQDGVTPYYEVMKLGNLPVVSLGHR